MEIKKQLEGMTLTLAPQGRVDTITAPDLDAAVTVDGIDKLVFDLSAVDYISSAGLRVLLSAQKRMAGRTMVIVNSCASVKEVFDITGFSDIFTFA